MRGIIWGKLRWPDAVWLRVERVRQQTQASYFEVFHTGKQLSFHLDQTLAIICWSALQSVPLIWETVTILVNDVLSCLEGSDRTLMLKSAFALI